MSRPTRNFLRERARSMISWRPDRVCGDAEMNAPSKLMKDIYGPLSLREIFDHVYQIWKAAEIDQICCQAFLATKITFI